MKSKLSTNVHYRDVSVRISWLFQLIIQVKKKEKKKNVNIVIHIYIFFNNTLQKKKKKRNILDQLHQFLTF
jgi:hypothetical protein